MDIKPSNINNQIKVNQISNDSIDKMYILITGGL